MCCWVIAFFVFGLGGALLSVWGEGYDLGLSFEQESGERRGCNGIVLRATSW